MAETGGGMKEENQDGGRGGGVYYNEWEPFAAQWLRNLMAAGLILEGIVDERSITELDPRDIPGRAHFFAGIGGWELALQLAGWPADLPVWTGSCPCQPFSAAGKRKGVEDSRHLWPDFRRLIAECGPPVVFGEQVASADGRAWLSGVRTDLEALGYQVGAADLCAAGVSAPHKRNRLFWVGYANKKRRYREWVHVRGRGPFKNRIEATGTGANFRTDGNAFWSEFIAMPSLEGKTRRIKPGIEPMVDGVPHRVGKVRAYGNAIVPQVAAEFIAAFLEAEGLGGGEAVAAPSNPTVTSTLPPVQQGGER